MVDDTNGNLVYLNFLHIRMSNKYLDRSCCMHSTVTMMMISRNPPPDDRPTISGRLLLSDDTMLWLPVFKECSIHIATK